MSSFPDQNGSESESGPPDAALDVDAAPARPKHTIGALLRETRESYGGDIERIANALRIRAQYLVAIEEGRYDRLPAPVYALGFVRAYAVHLGLDGEEAVRRFKQEASGFEISRDLVFPVPLGERGIPRGRILAAAVLLLLAAYGGWYYLSSGGRVRPERVSAVPASLLPAAPPKSAPTTSTPSVAPPASSPPVSATPAPASPAGPASPPTHPAADVNPPVAPVLKPPPGIAPLPSPHTEAGPPPQTAAVPSDTTVTLGPSDTHVFGVIDGAARIVIRARSDCWVKVRDQNGTTMFEHLLKVGDVYRVPDQPGLQLYAGNADGLTVTVDGRAAPPFTGKVRHDIRLDPALLKAGTAVVN
ncbi:MAG: helix-turn-helix domain-containing protein [Alphaproteobacteria bacterium]|nr:helix-turn-helix domain-containing protein [Alphaproteobacteria bacterium]